ncbi:MAG TPA: molecular chaperone DnaJ [Gammaproteobacteria bacterium]|nr:molecular chaperone DnaJ [Gammaproteobacteria bacterium]
MMSDMSRLPESLFAAIEQELEATPAGLREHDLLQRLRARGFFDFLPPPPAPPHALFQAHFLLFHALYRLGERLAGTHTALLEIGPLCIRRLPWRAGKQGLSQADPLRDYYLDWSNFEQTGEQEVAELIAGFWRRLARLDGRAAALAELGLEDPVDDATIKQTWRRLAMEHHPDRGGDTERLQALNAALECLIGQR